MHLIGDVYSHGAAIRGNPCAMLSTSSDKTSNKIESGKDARTTEARRLSDTSADIMDLKKEAMKLPFSRPHHQVTGGKSSWSIALGALPNQRAEAIARCAILRRRDRGLRGSLRGRHGDGVCRRLLSFSLGVSFVAGVSLRCLPD